MNAQTATQGKPKNALPAHHGGKLKTDDVEGRVLRVTGVPVHQRGRTHYVVSLKSGTVHDLITSGLLKVDEWSMSNQDGYQRAPTPSRVKKFSRYVREAEGFSPVTALLYCRDPKQVTAQQNDDCFELTIRLDPSRPIYVPDGQHRLYGLKEAVTTDPTFTDYELACMLMVAAPGKDPRYEEALQFNTINTNQKRVPTDLAQRFMLRQATKGSNEIGRDDKVPRDATANQLKPYAVAVVDYLNDLDGSPWKGLIETPNEPSGSTKPVSQNTFVESLLPLLKHASDYSWTVGKVVDTVVAYWSAVTEMCPEAMAHWKNDGCTDSEEEPHTSYVIRTTSGVFSLNAVLKWMTTYMPVVLDPTKQSAYEELMEFDRMHFSDSFWKSGEDATGAAARGTSRGVFSDIASEIQGEIAEHQ